MSARPVMSTYCGRCKKTWTVLVEIREPEPWEKCLTAEEAGLEETEHALGATP